MIRALLVLALFCCSPLFAAPPAEHYLTVCAIFQNEAQWLKEWIEFHRLVGVEHFVLYNHDSVDDWQEIVAPYVEEGIVEVIDFCNRYRRGTQAQPRAYIDCIKRYNGRTTWIAFIDIDEFLLPIECDDIKEILPEYEEYGGIVINWRCFGTNGVNRLKPRELLIERLTRTSTREGDRASCVKSILRPERLAYKWGVHQFAYRPPYFAVQTDHTPVPPSFTKGADRSRITPICDDRLIINHYQLRTIDWATGEKFQRSMRFFGRSEEEQLRVLLRIERNTNVVEDLRIQRFVPELRRRLFPNVSRPRWRLRNNPRRQKVAP